MTMQNYVIASSAIKALAYDDETEDCFVTFKDGKSYTLKKLPGIEMERWLNAESKGGYWNSFVRGNY